MFCIFEDIRKFNHLITVLDYQSINIWDVQFALGFNEYKAFPLFFWTRKHGCNPTRTNGISFIWNFIKCRRFKKDWKGHEVAFEERLLKCLGYFSRRWIQKYPKPKATFYGKLSTLREIKHLQKHGNIITLIVRSGPKCQSIIFQAPLLKPFISSSNWKDWWTFYFN